jgi:hypothetical protein
MSRHAVGALVVLLALGSGCAARSTSQPRAVASPGYELIYPPDVADERYPGGVHLLSDTPKSRWHHVALFATHEECESSRITRIDDSIDEARRRVGDKAKFELPVRRAVNARCVATR